MVVLERFDRWPDHLSIVDGDVTDIVESQKCEGSRAISGQQEGVHIDNDFV